MAGWLHAAVRPPAIATVIVNNACQLATNGALGHFAFVSATVPPILHYVWVGPEPLPERDRALIDGWRRIMPHWTIRAWTNDTVDFTSNLWVRRAFAMQAWNRVSNYIRMQVLLREGGVYLDTDVEVLKSFDPLLAHAAFVGFQADVASPHWRHGPHWVNNAVVGAAAGHWLPRAVLAHIESTTSGEEAIAGSSGPAALTHVLMQHGMPERAETVLDVDGVAVYPKPYFYPSGHDEALAPGMVQPETYAIHHWAASWVSGYRRTKLSRKIFKRVARLAPHLAYGLTRRRLAARFAALSAASAQRHAAEG